MAAKGRGGTWVAEPGSYDQGSATMRSKKDTFAFKLGPIHVGALLDLRVSSLSG